MALDNKGRKIVEFTADWCQPCKQVKPKIAELARQHRIPLEVVDVDQHPELTVKYDVQSVPTIILFEHGEPSTMFTGSNATENLAAVLNRSRSD